MKSTAGEMKSSSHRVGTSLTSMKKAEKIARMLSRVTYENVLGSIDLTMKRTPLRESFDRLALFSNRKDTYFRKANAIRPTPRSGSYKG
jgi:hypothetical protein